MKIFLDESLCREKLFPFTHTRHTADIRIGILTIREKWEILTGQKVYTSIEDKADSTLIISANIIPSKGNFHDLLAQSTTGEKSIEYPWHIFQYNEEALKEDFSLLTEERVSETISKTNSLVNENNIFVEAGAYVENCIINASTGPVYIGKNAVLMEGSMLRGPIAVCDNATVKMGTRIYGATTIGPYCVAGGEIKNSVMFGYSNKAHDGYLGDSVLGEWCNLGAGTSNSNVKNTASEVKFITGEKMEAIVAGNKGGLLMGDYSRAAINTSFNTGTVVGVCCNIFGRQFPEKYIPNFSWGDQRYEFSKAVRDIENWKKMKGKTVTAEEKNTLEQLYISKL